MYVKQVNVDRLLEDLGKHGIYQMRIYFLSCLPYVSIAWHMMIQTFQSEIPPFKCVHNNVSATPFSVELGQFHSDDCTVRFNSTSDVNGGLEMFTCGENDTHIQFDDGFGKTIVSEWELICSLPKQSMASMAGSFYMIGILVGSVTLCPLADMFGRRKITLFSLGMQFPLAISVAFIQDYTSFVVLRFFCGVFYAGANVLLFIICCEIMAKQWRSYVLFLVGCFWSVGFVSLGIIANFVRNWRHLQLIISIPSVGYISYYWLLPESLHWLATHHENDALEREIRKASRINKKSLKIEDYYENKYVEESNPTAVRVLVSICSHPLLLLHVVVMSCVWFVDALVYYGLSLFSTQLSGNRYVSFCLSGAIELPAYIAICLLLKWFGRQWTESILHMITGLVLILLAFTPTTTAGGTDLTILIICLALTGKFMITSAFMGVFLYTAELYPTSVRSVGAGITSMTSRFGGIFAPYAGVMASINSGLPPLVFGILAISAGFVMFLLPETRDVALMETPAEVEPSWIVRLCCFRDSVKHGKKRADLRKPDALGCTQELLELNSDHNF